MAQGKICEWCEERFWPQRSDARYCSPRCRKAGNRAGYEPQPPEQTDTEAAEELVRKLGTVIGGLDRAMKQIPHDAKDLTKAELRFLKKIVREYKKKVSHD